MTTPEPEAPAANPPKWQYSLKTLLVVTTGVCLWAKIASVLCEACHGPVWFKGVFVLWLGALLAQGALDVWAWWQLRRQEGPAAEIPYGRFRVGIAWGMVPLSLWLVLFVAAFKERTLNDGLVMFIGVTILHMALPTALLLTVSTLRGRDVFPVRVVRWAVVASCLVPLGGVALAAVMQTGW